MLFQPTTRVNLLRGTATDTYGDEVDSQTLVAEGIPAHVTETRKTVRTPASGTPRVVRSYTCRIPGTVDVQAGDRLEDASTGILYQIDSFTRPSAGAPVTDVRLDLRRA